MYRSSIHVLAGTNGAGKSSVAGADVRRRGGDYYNPDEAARTLLDADPELTAGQANALAWSEGIRGLRRAIREHRAFAFETTLGGNTVPALLEEAADAGLAVRVMYVGLGSADLHVQRVRSRVERGGHAIAESKIRVRYVRSLENLIRLVPRLAELVVWDNSAEADPEAGVAPRPHRILHYADGVLRYACPPAEVPEWAKPVYVAVYDLTRRTEI
jgi:predicted ABC-type ATPase